MQNKPKRLGFRYPHNPSETTLSDLERWIEDLSPLEPSWLLIHSDADRAVPEAFVRRLIDQGIEPIVHLDIPVGALRPAELNPLLYSYAHWGVHYAFVYDRPNMKESWASQGWNHEALVERYLDASLPILQAQFSAGMAPMLAPLQPGGDYWDTAFLRSALKGIARRGQRDLLESLVVTAHAQTQGQVLDWGAGGPSRWPAARPYFTPEGSQDQIGFHVFDWYAQICQDIVGKTLPIVAVSAGSPSSEPGTAQVNAAIARKLSDGSKMQPVIAFCFAEIPIDNQRQDWIAPAQPEPAPSAEAPAKSKSPSPTAIPQDLQTTKVLDHYLLLPKENQAAIPAWRNATAFALTHQPVVGFSAAEAAMARQVTIAGGTDLISDEIESLLRSAGCSVQRLTLMPQRKSACKPKPVAPSKVS
ncbi:MAG: hypothetical protein WBR18_09590 [Anaerolineales bacterium]